MHANPQPRPTLPAQIGMPEDRVVVEGPGLVVWDACGWGRLRRGWDRLRLLTVVVGRLLVPAGAGG